MPDALEQLTAHVRGHMAGRAALLEWRFAEVVRLVVRHWPHRHLAAIERAGGRPSKAIDHAVALVRAQVREQWEARHGIGPLWPLILRGTTDAVARVVVDLWWRDPGLRMLLRAMSRQAGDR